MEILIKQKEVKEKEVKLMLPAFFTDEKLNRHYILTEGGILSIYNTQNYSSIQYTSKEMVSYPTDLTEVIEYKRLYEPTLALAAYKRALKAIQAQINNFELTPKI